MQDIARFIAGFGRFQEKSFDGRFTSDPARNAFEDTRSNPQRAAGISA